MCLEISDLFLGVEHDIAHSFAALTREISCSTLEINLVFPRTHVLFSIYLLFLFIVDPTENRFTFENSGLLPEKIHFVMIFYIAS